MSVQFSGPNGEWGKPPSPPADWRPAAPVDKAARCTLCGAVLSDLASATQRCGACSLHQELGPVEPNPLLRFPAVVLLFTTLAVLYAVTYLVVWAR